jgi:hypothetical protein
MGIVQRSWRSVLLIGIGSLLGAALVAPVAASHSAQPKLITPATTYTRSASCAGREFYPADTRDEGVYDGSLREIGAKNGDGWFECDPGLPNGAVVTQVQFTLQDTLALGEVTGCSLVRNGLGPTTAATIDVLATVASTGGAATPGTVRRTDTTISSATIDTRNHAYWLQCQITTNIAGLGIYGANVVYTISAAQG